MSISTGDQVVAGKPEPDIYLEAARRLQVSSRACVAVEDSDAGIASAHAAGMIALMVPDLKPPSPASSQRAHGVFVSLHEVRTWLQQSRLDHIGPRPD